MKLRNILKLCFFPTELEEYTNQLVKLKKNKAEVRKCCQSFLVGIALTGSRFACTFVQSGKEAILIRWPELLL